MSAPATRDLADSLDMGLVIVDQALRVRLWNRWMERASGVRNEVAMGRGLWVAFPRLQHARVVEAIRDVLECGLSAFLSPGLHGQILPLTQPGSDRDLVHSVRLRPGVGPDGQRRCLIQVYDCSSAARREAKMKANQAELRRAKDAAEAAGRSKGEFLANMSHEIRTPMTAILGFAELLHEQDSTDPTTVEHVAAIRRNGEHLLGLINEILDLSKLEAGQVDLEESAQDPVGLAQEVMETFAAVVRDRSLSLDLVAEASPVWLRLDPLRFRQILFNLVGNAVKFTDEGRIRVELQLDRDAEAMVLAVDDSGIGMTEEQAGRLFQPFQQGDASMARRFGGTGLGLVIARRLARLMGGDLTLARREAGCRFELRLPARAAAAPAEQARPSSHVRLSGKRPLSGCRVLVAEDGRDNQLLLRTYLRKAGAEVELVENGGLAVDAVLAAEVPFDLIVMDMQMPVLSGYDATRRLREAQCSTPIVALTAHAMRKDREECLAAGCDEYLSKPIGGQLLVETLASLLSPS